MKSLNLKYLPLKPQLKYFRNYHRNNEEYIHQSIVPTDHFQKSLPRLPIPKLEDSCRRYLNALRPLLTSAQHEKTCAIVEGFQKNEGPALQKELEEKDKGLRHTSYISGPWFDMYLRDRLSLVLNYNPFLVFKDDARPAYMDQTIRATNFIISALRFRRSLKENVLEPDVYHMDPTVSDTMSFRKFVRLLPKNLSWYGAYWYNAYPLDMSQYGNLMNSTRIPKEEKDELQTDLNAKHILVIHLGKHYYFDVLDRDGNLVKAEDILANLRFICNQGSQDSSSKDQVGFLTSENRDVWAKARQKLISLGNEEQLDLIDSAIFIFVLEEQEPSDFSDLGKLFLFGDARNRWFDKSFSFIINKNGCSALHFEHSWGDGVALLRFLSDVYKDSTKYPRVHPDTKPANIDSSKIVREIEWNTNDDIETLIQNAKKTYHANTSKLDMTYLMYPQLNKNLLKDKQISPDSFMQLAFQMAYYQIKGITPATYEACSTAAFKHGRTETIRSATTETQMVCRTFENSNPRQLYEMMKKCSLTHNQLTMEAALGQGFDRHLLALKVLAKNHGKLPDFYEDSSYKFINHVTLSTSSLNNPAISFGGFAPVVPDGYGFGYSANSEFLGCVITAYQPTNNSTDIRESLLLAIKKLHHVLNQIDP